MKEGGQSVTSPQPKVISPHNRSHFWSEVTSVRGEVTYVWGEVTFGWGEVTGGEMTVIPLE